ncbi:arsenate reductase (glutaredoxin) [Sphingomonas sp. SRS2]|uniref:arsenate reductase (glutaredoxin) n=1 Tax=Sphingomonas sp. SRS2 TaxID=133190 RepID=UPI0006184E34|nr:arsenate reductase (glutaredoxin) [Sphingomonas sp. SRS2]KKC24765.1 arsenate reductase [Sphingomonas sp. SRS2]
MSHPFQITIFHNPSCGTSRNTVAIVEAAGYAPEVVRYLETGWTKAQLHALLTAMGARPRDVLREKGTPAAELGLLASEINEETLLDAMIEHPILVNRPIVVTPKGTKLCRPSETVLELLDKKPEQFTKEDGEVVRL